MNYQKLVLIGNATRDAEYKTSKTGDVYYTTFSVAVNDSKDRATFFPITVFGKQAKAVAEYVKKGREVLVEGRIETSENGRMSVVADRVVFGAGKKDKAHQDEENEEAADKADE